jgi:hypothetical protein
MAKPFHFSKSPILLLLEELDSHTPYIRPFVWAGQFELPHPAFRAVYFASEAQRLTRASSYAKLWWLLGA